MRRTRAHGGKPDEFVTHVRLISRNLKNVTKQYPTVAAAIAGIKSKQALLDGEIVAVDANGRPSFQALQHRATTDLYVIFYAFDMLNLEGLSLMKQPLEQGRSSLRAVVEGSAIRLSEPLPGTPAGSRRPFVASASRASSPSVETRATSRGSGVMHGSKFGARLAGVRHRWV